MSTKTNRELQETLIATHVAIVFDPLPQEVSYVGAPLPPSIFDTKIVVPQSRENDPFQFAKTCTDICEGKSVCVLLPGKKFDVYGTRHGRGGGWYDRFLSAVPTFVDSYRHYKNKRLIGNLTPPQHLGRKNGLGPCERCAKGSVEST